MLINGRRFTVQTYDQHETLGVVRDDAGKVVAGWSRDDGTDEVHVLGTGSGEWRGTGLRDTLERALLELEGRP